MQRIYLLVASVVLLAGILAMSSYGIAFAAASTHAKVLIPNTTCAQSPSETNCTGQDPIAQGCNGDATNVQGGIAYVHDDKNNLIGEVDLRYSSKCKSNWARTVFYFSGSVNLSATVTRQTDGKSFTYTAWNTSVYTNMVYAPVAKAQACGRIEGYYGACTPYLIVTKL